MEILPEFYIDKFKDWCHNLKFNNPLEYDNIVDKIILGDSKEVFWIDFKNPKFSTCIVQRHNQLTDFEFYISQPYSDVNLKHCQLENYYTTLVNYSDFRLLSFLAELGMIEYRSVPLSSSLFEIKFTLKERILENGSHV